MSISGNCVAEGIFLEKSFMESSKGTQTGKLQLKTKDAGKANFEEDLLRVETRDILSDLEIVTEKLFRFPSDKVLEEYRSVVGQILQKAESMLEIRRDFSMICGSSRLLIDRTRKGLSELEKVIGREGKRSRIMGITTEIQGCLLSLLA